MPRRRIAIALACATFLALLTVAAPAQTANGKITGTIRMASGPPVGGAAVTITNQSTGATRVVRTTENGVYEASDLPPGSYSVAVDVQGYRKAVLSARSVDAGGTTVVDFALEVIVAEEVTVTAMKREETVFDTPVSVVAPTEEVLRERGVETLEDVSTNVANFTVQNLGPGQNQVSIRGVSSGQIARDQPGVKESVGAYLDESVVSLSLFTPDLDLFDMNRVEVLRGPQGTLFGSGSLSGTVRYITNQPELGVTRFFGEATGNLVGDGEAGGGVKAGFNMGLGDTAALRVSAYYGHIAGYMDAVQPDLSVQEDVNSGDRFGFRAAMQFAASDRLTITPRFAYQKIEMDGWNRIDIYNILANPYTTTRPAVTLGPRELFTQIEEPTTDEFILGDLNIRYDFGEMVLTSVTSYTIRDILVVRDAGALTSSITGGSIGLAENVYTLDSPLDDKTDAKGFSQEIRLSGGSDTFNWVGGGFYADATREYGQSLFVDGFQTLTGIPTVGLRAGRDVLFFSDLGYDFTQFALFGEASYVFSPTFTLTGGLRYYSYDEDKDQVFDGIFAHDNTGTTVVSQPGSTSADGIAPRVIATWRASENTNVNAQISKGFRLGGINDPLNIPLCSAQDLITFGNREQWEDETTWNYEIGSKTRFLNGNGAINASFFYTDISDLQVTVTAGTCSSRIVFNVPNARSIGGELEFAATLSENFDFAVSAGVNEATLESTLTQTNLDGSVVVISGIEEGRRLPGVPDFQFAAAATYQQPVGQGMQGYVTGTYTYIGSRFTQVGDEVPGFGTVNLNWTTTPLGGPLTATQFHFDPELPSYSIVNLRAGVRFDNFDIAIFGNNLFDERAFLSLDRERGLRARVGYLTNQPQTFGITTRVDF